MKRLLLVSFLFVLVVGCCQAEDFKFALLTDIHISKNPSAAEDLERSVAQINKASDLAFVLVSGDITEEGDCFSLHVAKDILDKLSIPYYIIPGNHDTKWTESGATCFAQIFGSDRFEFEYGGFLFLGFNSGPIVRIADGHVSPQDVDWLKSRLSANGKEKPVFLVTHYPMRIGDVDNSFDVTDAVRGYNIKAFIGGHYHANQHLSYDGIPGILGRSNLRGNDAVGGYSVFEICGDSLKVSEQRIGGTLNPWAGMSLTETYYDAETLVDKRPDIESVNRQYPDVKAVGSVQLGSALYSSPEVYKNNVYIGDENGVMSCLDVRTGELLWQFKSGNRIVGTCAVDKNIVVFGSTDKCIYGLDAEQGNLLWKLQADEPVLGAVSIDKGIAYVGASDGKFRAIDIKTGKLLWSYDEVKGYIETRPLVTKKYVVFGAWDNTLYCLDKESGEVQWTWTGGLTRMHYSPAAVWPVETGNKTVFIVDPQRAMTAIDLKTGQTCWRTRESAVRESIGISADKKRVFGKTMQDSVVCFAAKMDKPRKIWATDVGFGYEFAPSMLEESEGIVFGSTKNGMIFALDSEDGSICWKHLVGNCLMNTVYPLSGKEVIYSSTDGNVGLLRWEE